jgi:spore germination protein YaaH
MDMQVFHRVFSSRRAVARLLEQATELASDPLVAGIHLDVEMYNSLDAVDIAAYRKFLTVLADNLAGLAPAKTVSVFLPFQSKAQLYDQASLQRVHHVVVQGYDAHWLESKTAGPVAPLDGPYALTWKKAVAYADDLGIPRSRQFMSYPLYGYEWKVGGANTAHATTQGKGSITTFSQPSNGTPTKPTAVSVMERVARYGATFDPVAASSYYRFRGEDGQRWEGWFDDWWGLRQKSEYLSNSELGGMAFFLLGYDNGVLIEHYLQRSTNSKTTN